MRPLGLFPVVWLCAGCAYPEFAFAASDVDAATHERDTAIEDADADVVPLDTRADADGNEVADADDVGDGAGPPVHEASCKDIRTKSPAAATGKYTIDPDGAGPLTPFAVFCEMSIEGGGWTLALKLDGSLSTFAYDSPYWTNEALLNAGSTDLSDSEAKFRSFNELPFTQLRLRMVEGTTAKYIIVDAVRSSLRALFSGGSVATTAGRAKWLTLVTDPVLQASCNAEGINQDYSAAFYGARPKLRIGIVGNNEANCDSPDSFIGFGATITTPEICYGGVDPAVVVGNVASGSCMAPKDKANRTMGYIFVR